MNREELELKFYQGLFEDHTPSGMIGVTSIIYPCLRKAFYTKQFGTYFDLRTAYTFFLGKAVHNMPFLEESEREVKWNGIIGKLDDYENGTLVEKKTCENLPLSANRHHITQLEYYVVLCLKNDIPITDAWLLYLSKDDKKSVTHKFIKPRLRDLSVVEKEMVERKDILEKALKTKEAPDRVISWLCNYCQFTPKCFGKKNERRTNT